MIIEKLIKKYEIQLANLKENKITDDSSSYPYEFDINRVKGFINDLKGVVKTNEKNI